MLQRVAVKKMVTKTAKGKNTDQALLELVRRYPGLSQYELGKKLKWTIGKVDGAIRRLLNSGEIYLRVITRAKGRKVNLVYPKAAKTLDVIEVPEPLLETSNPVWQNEAFIYALDNTTIGISGRPILDWSEVACFTSRVPLSRSDRRVSLRIPDNFVSFYNLDKKHRSVFLNENNLLVTVSGEIIETKDYPS